MKVFLTVLQWLLTALFILLMVWAILQKSLLPSVLLGVGGLLCAPFVTKGLKIPVALKIILPIILFAGGVISIPEVQNRYIKDFISDVAKENSLGEPKPVGYDPDYFKVIWSDEPDPYVVREHTPPAFETSAENESENDNADESKTENLSALTSDEPATKVTDETTSESIPITETSETESEFITEETVKEDNSISYVLNNNTMTFHYPDCDSVNEIHKENIEYSTETREQIALKNYKACKNCNP